MEKRILNLLAKFIALKKPTQWNQSLHCEFALAVLACIPREEWPAIASTMPSLLSNASAFKQMFTKKHENADSEYHGKFFSPLSDSAAIGAAILKLDEE